MPPEPDAKKKAPPAPAPVAPVDADDLFVSCVPGRGAVARYAGTETPGKAPMIGAVIDTSVEGNIRYIPDHVEFIPGAEYRKYSKEYRRALADRALRMRTREEFEAQQRKA